jgi:hypothetical protein
MIILSIRPCARAGGRACVRACACVCVCVSVSCQGTHLEQTFAHPNLSLLCTCLLHHVHLERQFFNGHVSCLPQRCSPFQCWHLSVLTVILHRKGTHADSMFIVIDTIRLVYIRTYIPGLWCNLFSFCHRIK